MMIRNGHGFGRLPMACRWRGYPRQLRTLELAIACCDAAFTVAAHEPTGQSQSINFRHRTCFVVPPTNRYSQWSDSISSKSRVSSSFMSHAPMGVSTNKHDTCAMALAVDLLTSFAGVPSMMSFSFCWIFLAIIKDCYSPCYPPVDSPPNLHP